MAATLTAAGACPFLPLYRRVMYYSHRQRIVEAPLFSCYLFLWGRLDHAFLGISSKRAASIIPVSDQATFSHEIEQLRRVLEGGANLGPYRFLVRGRRVRVTSGPFEGTEGVIEDGAPEDRLILRVHAIGRALSLEIDASLLEPVD